ncbi:MAG: DUF4282 domain-containing protein [Pseudomonadota bacterium]
MEKNFFSKLFDFSFYDFITPTIIKVLYAVNIFSNAVFSIAVPLLFLSPLKLLVRSSESRTFITILSILIISPILFIISTIWTRVFLEFFVALIRVAQNTTDILRIARDLPLTGTSFTQAGNIDTAAQPLHLAESPPADLLERSHWLASRGRTQEAIVTLKELIKTDPDNMPSLDLLSNLYEQRKDYRNLKVVLEKLTLLDPGNVAYMERLAKAIKLYGNVQ